MRVAFRFSAWGGAIVFVGLKTRLSKRGVCEIGGKVTTKGTVGRATRVGLAVELGVEIPRPPRFDLAISVSLGGVT